MPITTFEGPMGEGKSLTAVTLAYVEHIERGKKIISNNHLNFEYTPFDREMFVSNLESTELYNCVLILDEGYLYVDARSSASKMNKLFTYFAAQTRKRGVDLYITVHHIDVIDKRLRRAVDVRGTCRYKKEIPCRKCSGSGILIVKGISTTCSNCRGFGFSGIATTTFFDNRTGKSRKIRILAPAFWSLYNTEEIVPLSKRQMNISAKDL